MSKPRLQIISASVRQGRVGLPVARWFHDRAIAHDGFEIDFADLAEIDLPPMDEPNLPRLRKYTRQHTKDWSIRVDAADAFVMITPEYNHGYTAPLKNAIDHLNQEWMYKPVGIVSYGGVAAGTRAAEMLKQVVVTLKMMPIFETVAIPFVQQLLDENRQLRANDVMEQAATDMLNELARWEEALRPLRKRLGPPG